MPQRNDAHDPFRDTIGQLASAVEERPVQAVDEAPPARSSRQVYWGIAGLCAVVIAAIEVTMMMRSDDLDAPSPPPRVLAALENGSCLERTRTIVDAIGRYADVHGGPPPNLAALTPNYVSFAPVDPASSQPLGYQVIGGSVTVSCPIAGSRAGSSTAGRPGM